MYKRQPAPRAVSGAAAVYGTSIDQGGCASHPGMAFPAILARALDVQIYNFGFSGNACLEPEMADVLARVPGLRLLVVDAEANAGPLGCLGDVYKRQPFELRGGPAVRRAVRYGPQHPGLSLIHI